MRTTKTSKILATAAQHLRHHGLAKGTVVNRWTGEVDVIGALQLAAGVPFYKLDDDIGTAVAELVPQGNLPGFLAAFEAVDGETDGIYEWQDSTGTDTETAASLLEKLAGRYSRSPTLERHYYA